MNLKPLGNRLIVRRVDAIKESKGGIIIPDNAKEKPQEGTVLAVGPGVPLENGTVVTIDVAVGDKILFSKAAGTEVTLDGEKLLILKEEDVFGVLV